MNENIVKIIPIFGLPEFKKKDNLIQILDVAFNWTFVGRAPAHFNRTRACTLNETKDLYLNPLNPH